jgi:hypothetical protein
MGNIGKDVIEVRRWLSDFHKDLSTLLGQVDSSMKDNKECETPWGTTSWSGSSASFQKPQAWIPRHLFRLYALRPKGEETVGLHKRWAFFIVYLEPAHLSDPEPVALWGVMVLRKADKGSVFQKWLLTEEGPAFLNAVSAAAWTQPEPPMELKAELEAMHYQSCPLEELNSAAEVQQRVVEPLWKKLNE